MVKYPGYHVSPVTGQNSGHDWFPPAAHGWGKLYHVPEIRPTSLG
jgi:hypothetical protein